MFAKLFGKSELQHPEFRAGCAPRGQGRVLTGFSLQVVKCQREASLWASFGMGRDPLSKMVRLEVMSETPWLPNQSPGVLRKKNKTRGITLPDNHLY